MDTNSNFIGAVLAQPISILWKARNRWRAQSGPPFRAAIGRDSRITGLSLRPATQRASIGLGLSRPGSKRFGIQIRGCWILLRRVVPVRPHTSTRLPILKIQIRIARPRQKQASEPFSRSNRIFNTKTACCPPRIRDQAWMGNARPADG